MSTYIAFNPNGAIGDGYAVFTIGAGYIGLRLVWEPTASKLPHVPTRVGGSGSHYQRGQIQ